MVIRVLLLLLSLFLIVNICIIALCYVMRENLYKKYGRQMIIALGSFVILVAALYLALAFVALK